VSRSPRLSRSRRNPDHHALGDALAADLDPAGGEHPDLHRDDARRVTVELKVADQALAGQGRTVTVTVPGGKALQGKIAEVGAVATAQENASTASGGTSSAAADARIRVAVTIADQAALGSLNAAPVDVDLVSEERKDVLAVPVAALLALTDGGYGVEIVDGDTTRIVAVKIGMFAAGRVEISGEGIAEGMMVGVPT